MDERTSINIRKEVLLKLKKERKYPRETYNEVLCRLMKKEVKLPK